MQVGLDAATRGMEGWLEKSSAGHKSGAGLRGYFGNSYPHWDRRYVVLSNGLLRYYNREPGDGGTLRGTFDCRGAKFENFPENFVLTSTERELAVRIENVSNLAGHDPPAATKLRERTLQNQWAAALEAACSAAPEPRALALTSNPGAARSKCTKPR